MKINTDGVVLAVLAGEGFLPGNILDIGTGTGVVALMLAQRFPQSIIEAVEIDVKAAITAHENLRKSPFRERLQIFPLSFQCFSQAYPHKKFDLIVSNPPFFIDSLKNPIKEKEVARHADVTFFSELVDFAARHLTESGVFSLILPPETAEVVKSLATRVGLSSLYTIEIKSFPHSTAHRYVLNLSRSGKQRNDFAFVIYSSQRNYSDQFVNNLRDFFTIFE